MKMFVGWGWAQKTKNVMDKTLLKFCPRQLIATAMSSPTHKIKKSLKFSENIKYKN